MKFVAIDKNRFEGDSDGKGWPIRSRAKEFDEATTIKEVWDWYKDPRGCMGILEIIPLE